jgi:hypothetical protein
MPPWARLTVLFDCCHSGSAIELPYVYRPNSAGQVNLIDNVKQGINLASAAINLLHGGFTAAKVNDAKQLIGGAQTFFKSLHHRPDGPVNEHGLGEETFVEDWKHEGKDVWMFSGCADNQTSADTSIAGAPTGKLTILLNVGRIDTGRCHVLWIHQNDARKSESELCRGRGSFYSTLTPTDNF